MNYESSPDENIKLPAFEVLDKRPGITQYIFPHVVVNINFQQEENRGAPELIYATYDRDSDEASLDKPAYKRPGVDMQYVVTCIQTVAQHVGETRFWVSPYNEDSLGGERRVEQWKKHFKEVEEAPEHGYYIYI
jgi:hypothetical protein